MSVGDLGLFYFIFYGEEIEFLTGFVVCLRWYESNGINVEVVILNLIFVGYLCVLFFIY